MRLHLPLPFVLFVVAFDGFLTSSLPNFLASYPTVRPLEFTGNVNVATTVSPAAL